MKPSVYIETTIVSYLVAGTTKDLVQAAHQRVTREWWAERDRFELFVSAAVVVEARRGDVTAAARRLQVLRAIPQLAAGPRVGCWSNPSCGVERCRRAPESMPCTSPSQRSTESTTFLLGIFGTSPTPRFVGKSTKRVGMLGWCLRSSARQRN